MITPEQEAERIVFAWMSFIMTQELSQAQKADHLLWAIDETFPEEKRESILDDLRQLSRTIIEQVRRELDDWLSR